MPVTSYVIKANGLIDDFGASSGGAPDEKVKVSVTDTNIDYLINKLVAGTFIALTRENPGATEDIKIDATGASAINVTYVPATSAHWDVSPSYSFLNTALDQVAARIDTLESSLSDSSFVTYTPSTLSNWDTSTDPGNVDDALDQLASRVKALEVSSGGFPDASNVTYSPAVTSNWNSSTDPGDVDNALDQLAARVKTIETNPPNASVIPYTPSTLSDWNSSLDPGDLDDALNQLASRLKTAETSGALPIVSITATDTTPDYLNSKITAGSRITLTRTNAGANEHLQITADIQDSSIITYTPGALSNWNSSTDPGDVDDALNQLAARLKTAETTFGPAPDASAVTFTPTTLTDWTSSTDPGNVDDALDQVAGRIKVVEGNYSAGTLPYTPTTLSNWNSSTDLGDINDAVDQLAARIKTVETSLPQDASVITYTPATTTNWNSNTDPGDTDNALDQLAARVKSLETSIVVDASNVTYTPSTLSNWNSSTDPGNTDAALNQLASRVKSLETTATDASNVSYAPSTLSDWNSSTDPGQADDALDQLASRVKTIETTPPNASVIPYTPSTLSDWNSSADPGDTDDALNQLAARVKTIELSGGGGGAPDASVVTYTPTTNANWNSSTDPGDVNDALDQLADRLKTVETSGGGGGAVGFVAVDTTINSTETIPSDHEMIVVDEVIIQSGSLTVTGRLCVIESEIVNESTDVGFDPADSTKWNSTPHNAKGALDELASRVKTIETGGGGGSSIVYHKWDVFAPPVSPSAADDEFSDATFNTSKWSIYDPGANSVAASEDDQGLLLSGDGDANEWNGVYQSLPSGNFSISTYVMGYSITENNSQFGLALFENGSVGSSGLAYLGFLSGVDSYIVSQTHANYNDVSPTQLSYATWSGTGVFLRIRRNGTTFYGEFSNDGQSWFNHPSSFTLGYVPTHMGLVFRRNTSTSNYRLRSRFFRYINSDVDLYAPINGRSIAVLTSG